MNLLELAKNVGLQPKLASSTQGGEYHSACPSCGGKDRFIIQPDRKTKNCSGRYFCRQCETKGDTIQFGRDFCGFSFSEAVEHANATMPQKTFLSDRHKKLNSYRPQSLTPPSSKWIAMANSFAEEAHQQILQQPKILKSLEVRGLTIEAVKRYKIGWNPTESCEDKKNWGLTDNGKRLWLPKGIVIPFNDREGNVIKLKIRRSNWSENDTYPKYVAIPGSMNGLCLVGDIRHNTMIVVESELDAYAIHHTTDDFTFVVAIGSSMISPDNVTDHHAKTKKHLLICHDNDEAGKKMFAKWKRLYPKAKGYPTPIGKDIGEAFKEGLNIREWILLTLPINERHEIIEKIWDTEDQPIIAYALKYFRSQTEIYKENSSLVKKIALGPNSPQAKKGELQQSLKFMKQSIEEHQKTN